MAIETPAVVIDRGRFEANLELVRRLGTANCLNVRPHIKTHKCIEIAELQMAAGGSGITASKTSEARVFVEAGFPSVTVAYPVIDSAKARRLIDVAEERGCDLRFIVDSEATASAVGAAAGATRYKVRVYIKIDVGLHRVGLRPESASLASLARVLGGFRYLEPFGLLSHAGHAYGARSVAEIRDIAENERRQMLLAQERLRSAGLSVSELSVGSTPTVLAAKDFEGITEIRPGNYVFFDLTAVRLGVARTSDVALSVLTSVVSVNDDYAIIDAGSKVLSSDLGPHGTAGVSGFGKAFPLDRSLDEEGSEGSLSIEKLSEEHGFIRRENRNVEVGDRLRIVPNHCCPVANLARQLISLGDHGQVEYWEVAAAGKVL